MAHFVGGGGVPSASASDSDSIQTQILTTLSGEAGEIADSYAFARDLNLDHQSVVGALKALLVDR